MKLISSLLLSTVCLLGELLVTQAQNPNPLRYVAFSDLSPEQATAATTLFFDEIGWDYSVASVQLLSWFSIVRPSPSGFAAETLGVTREDWDAEAQLAALELLGYTEAQWDCWVNHYGGYSWEELVQFDIAPYYRTFGWDEDSWNGVTDPPNSNLLEWAALSAEQQTAAASLCLFEDSWNLVLPVFNWTVPEPSPTSAPSVIPVTPTDAPSHAPFVKPNGWVTSGLLILGSLASFKCS